MTILSRPDSRGDKTEKRSVYKGDEDLKKYRGVRESWVLPPTIPWLFFLGVLLADDSGLAHWIGEDGGYVPRGCPIPCHGLELDVEFRLEGKSRLN